MGRERELAELDAALRDALGGRGSLVLLTGEPGIGKTALARALVQRASVAGAGWVWGTCWDGGGAPAYWPWMQVLRALGRQEDLEALRERLGAGASWVASLLPELVGVLGAPPQPSELDSDQARFRLFDALASLLAAAGDRRPLVVVLDDLHWADASSLFALEFVARTLPDAAVLVLACYRHAEAHHRDELGQPLGGLARAGSRIPLQGLGQADVARLLARRAGDGPGPGVPHPGLVTAVHQATGGNPFFADELAQLLAAQGRLGDPATGDRPLPLPDGVRDAIRRRLAPLADDAHATLEAAAVIGGHFRLLTLAAMLGRPTAEILELLEAPLQAELLSAAGEPGRYAFAHALVRATLLEGLGTARRARLHRAAGEALERLYADDPEPRLSELAHHFLQSAAQGGAERAVAYAERAASHAAERFAYDEAARLLRQALAVAETLGPDEERGWRLSQALGEALLRGGDPDGARAALQDAATHARRLGDARRLARVALADVLWGFVAGGVDTWQVALLEEALDGVDALPAAGGDEQRAEDAALGVQLRVRLAMALYWAPEVDRRERLIEEALDTARRLAAGPDAPIAAQRTLALALAQGFVATWGPETLAVGLPASQEALEICERTGDVELALQVRSWRCSLLLELDDPIRADEEIEIFGRLARRLRQPRTLVYDPLHRAMRAHLRGEFAEAEQHTAEAVAEARRVPGTVGIVIAEAQAFFQALTQGRHIEMEAHVRHAAETLPAVRAWRCALALVLADCGREAEARSELERLAARNFAGLPPDCLWLVGAALLAETCARLGDVEHARQLYARMAPFEGRNVVSLETAYLGPVSRFLGLLAMTASEHERALGHLEDARASAARVGARPAAAQAALDAAEALLRRSGPGDHERAATLLEGAAPEAERLGMTGTLRQAEDLRARLAALHPAAAVAASAAPSAPAGPPAPPASAEATDRARLRRDGDVWSLDFAGRTVHLRDAKGLRQLAVLLAAPGAEVPATELAAAGESGPAPSEPGAGLDAVRARVAEVRAELHEAEAFNDPERAARAREELERIAAGLAGEGAEPVGDASERARVNVTRAIRTALKRIAEHDPELGRLLHTTVRTGARCSYEPDPYRPVRWEVGA